MSTASGGLVFSKLRSRWLLRRPQGDLDPCGMRPVGSVRRVYSSVPKINHSDVVIFRVMSQTLISIRSSIISPAWMHRSEIHLARFDRIHRVCGFPNQRWGSCPTTRVFFYFSTLSQAVKFRCRCCFPSRLVLMACGPLRPRMRSPTP